MRQQPQVDISTLEAILAHRPADVAAWIRRVATDVRPCVYVRSRRASKRPLRMSALDRLLGRKPAIPVLPILASKFGGIPYVEREDEVEGNRFLGQINFAEVITQLHAQQAPIPEGMPRCGLLAIDLVKPIKARVRWYPEPDETICRATQAASWGRYEASINFNGGWSLQGLEWYSGIPNGDGELWEAMNDFSPAGLDEDDAKGCHKLFGHANEVLNEYFDAQAARPGSNPSDYRLIWRITFDNPADFAWGTNWLYVVIHQDDLRRNAFDKAVVMVANA